MTITSLLVAGLLTSQDSTNIAVEPGCSQAYLETLKQISTATQEGDFKKADQLAGYLPSKKINLSVNYSELPENLRSDYKRAVNQAIEFWKKVDIGLEFEFTTKPNLMVQFADILPIDEDSGLPKGMVLFTGYQPPDVRIEAVIAYQRMKPAVTAESNMIRSDVGFAIGEYLGLARTPKFGSVMFRSDGLSTLPLAITGQEKYIAMLNIKQSDEIRAKIAKKEKFSVDVPAAFIDQTKISFGTVNQGDVPIKQFEVYNRGKVPLKFRLRPDCTCLSLNFSGEVAPGTSSVVSVAMNTLMFPGDQKKAIFVYTNDPEHPIYRIDFDAYVKPYYTVENLYNEQVFYIGKSGGVAEFFIYPGDQPFKIEDASLIGPLAEVTYKPHQAKVMINGEEVEKSGYLIQALISPTSVQGKTLASLSLKTDSELFPTIAHRFEIQKGIAVNPTVIYLGEINNEPLRAWAILSQPGKTFKITSLESDNKNFVPSYETLPNGDIKLVVSFTGQGEFGSINCSITVKTDDAGTPEIKIPIQGEVK